MRWPRLYERHGAVARCGIGVHHVREDRPWNHIRDRVGRANHGGLCRVHSDRSCVRIGEVGYSVWLSW